jgi:hypothetical protein
LATVTNNNNNNNNNNNKIRRMWNVENQGKTCNNIGDWDHSKSFREYVSNIPENHEFKELQKTAMFGTAHILRKVLL